MNDHNNTAEQLLKLLAATAIAFSLARVMEIAPDWGSGVAPAFPGQYEGRALAAVTTTGILWALFLPRDTPRGRALRRLGLGLALAAIVARVVLDV